MQPARIGTKKYIREQVILRDKSTCNYCGKAKLKGRALHIDHVIPESKGGAYTEVNLVVSCSACNIRKGNKDALAYARHRLKQLELEKRTLEQLLL